VRDTNAQVTTSGNVDTGRRKQMTVHAASFGKMMSMFSNQYSNGALAVVREYFCNGDDSRVAAGVERPTDSCPPRKTTTTRPATSASARRLRSPSVSSSPSPASRVGS
jgi:hypothetical protein